MKIRTDFVTNSSSSSFIVEFDEVPKTMEELKGILFGNEERYDIYPTEYVATTVFNDMKDGSAKIEDLVQELEDYIPGAPDYYDYDDYASYQLAAMVTGTEYINNNYNDLSKVYIFSYGDEDGPYYSALEREGLFENVKYKRISHH